MLRSSVKAVAEVVLARGGPARIARVAGRSSTLVLAYHNIVPDHAEITGDPSLHLPRTAFAAQLDELARTHDIVPLDALRGPDPKRVRRPRAVITFDDAYRGAVTIGVEELARRGLPATIFVAPGFVGGRAFWWDALATAGSGELPAPFRELALTSFRGVDRLIRERAPAYGLMEIEPAPYAVAATEEELRWAARVPGITFGSHSWSHPNLARLGPEELRAELVDSLAWLSVRLDPVVPWLAYPYGVSSLAVERAAAEAGYVAALRVTGGRIPRRGANPYSIPRLNVPGGLSIHGFVLRTAGLIGSR